jgi:DnaJ family protein B protein 12
MNKDEASRCLDISKNKYKQGETESAVRFAKKSISLFETPEATQWLTFLSQNTFNSQESSQDNTRNLRNRKKPEPATSAPEETRKYSSEQLKGIQDIIKHKAKGNLYAILGISNIFYKLHRLGQGM